MGMASKASQSLLLLLAGLASFYLAARWHEAPGGQADGATDVVEAMPSIERRVPPDVTPASLPLERDTSLALPQRDRVVPESGGDAFVALSWLPPVAPPPPPAPAPVSKPPPPSAPPLPFTFVGMLEAGAVRPQAFLSKGDALLVVAAGDTLDNNTYRVDSLSSQQIVITYLPMNLQQTLTVAGATP